MPTLVETKVVSASVLSGWMFVCVCVNVCCNVGEDSCIQRLSKKSCGQEKMQPSNSSDAKTRESIATIGTAIVSFPMTRHFQ